MHVVKEYPNGLFSWVDLSTPNTEEAKAFYSGLFGWEAIDMPTDMGTMYTMLQIDGKNVAGLGPMPPNVPAGTPAYWSSYVKHDDADAIMAKVSGAGGQVIMPAMDVMDSGRMGIMQDPTGAMVGVWQPKEHIGAQLVNMPNTLVWNELQTKDVAAAQSFYVDVFGWTTQLDEKSNYVMFAQDGRVQAGLMEIAESWGDVPPNWAVYFLVSDLADTVNKAQALGGSVMVPPTPAGDMGSFAVIGDPQGGAFTVMQIPADKVDPPPGA